jgi:cyclopropane fatty-acyl-phospholipid synthase-like methyltransferase
MAESQFDAAVELYRDIDSEAWRLLVYNPVHGGEAFANLGGVHFLNYLEQIHDLDSTSEILELCAGLGTNCVHLAETHGARVTGIEINTPSVKLGRQRILQRAKAKLKVSLVQGDVQKFRAFSRYDLIFSIESIVLIKDAVKMFPQVYRALRNKGSFGLGEIVAGRSFNDSARRIAAEDAMQTLLSPEQYVEAFSESGFAYCDYVVQTDLAISQLRKIEGALLEHASLLCQLRREALLEGWCRVVREYLKCFVEHSLEYVWMHGRKSRAAA